MCKLILTAGLCLVIASLASSTRLVCYYNSAAQHNVYGNEKFTVSDIDPYLCTHVIYAFSGINYSNRLVPSHGTDIQSYRYFNELKTRNPKLKTLLAVGDVIFNREKFSRFRNMLWTQRTRAVFIKSVIGLLRSSGFDGLNLDWRFPERAGGYWQDKQRFTSLCKELKLAFEAEGKATYRASLLITASVSADKATIYASYEVVKIATYLDFINVLTYDFHGPLDSITGHHSSSYEGYQDTGDKIYSNNDYATSPWWDQGVPSEKLNLGLALYGQVDFHTEHIGAPEIGHGEYGSSTGKDWLLPYYKICLYNDDDKNHNPYARRNQWDGYDNKYSLRQKVNYINTNHFGGAAVWSLDLDDYSGKFCKQGKYPFIRLLHSLLVPGLRDVCYGKKDGRHPNPHDPYSYYDCNYGKARLQRCPSKLVFQEHCKCCDDPQTHSQNPCYGKKDGRHPNPHDPYSYYDCSYGKAQLQKCPSKLVFQEYCKCCDHPQTHSQNPCYGKKDGRHPNPHDPYSYYDCSYGKAQLQKCPSKLVFRENCKCCDDPNTNSQNPCYGKKDGRHPNPHDPYSYYDCSYGKAQLQKCPSKLVFRENCKCCDDPKTNSQNPCYGKKDGRHPNPHDPYSYYDCNYGKARLQRCPSKLVFQEHCKCCDAQTHSQNPCYGKKDGRHPNPHDPYSYYDCSYGKAQLQKCPSKLVFREYCKCCDDPKTNSQNPCYGKKDGRHPNPHDPYSYYDCSYGKAQLQKCPSKLVFREYCKCCDDPNTHSDNPCYGKKDGLYPHSHDQHSFYSCGYGKAYLLKCPANFVFKQYCRCCQNPTTTLIGNPCYGRKNGLYANPHDPYSFHYCGDGIVYLKSCPYNKVFKESCGCCDYPKTTHTGNPCYGGKHGFHPNTQDPHSFYKCDHGKAHLLPCPAYTVYEPSCHCCIYPRSIGNPCHEKSGVFHNPYDAHSFYNCDHGRAHLIRCPAKLVFKQSCRCCDRPTASFPNNPCKGKKYGLYPNYDDPHSFYNCGNGIAYLRKCPGNLVFKKSCSCCDFSNTTPTETCYGKSSGYHRNPYDRHSFYNCGNGVSHLLQCPDNWIYNQSGHFCDNPTTADSHYGENGGIYSNHHY